LKLQEKLVFSFRFGFGAGIQFRHVLFQDLPTEFAWLWVSFEMEPDRLPGGSGPRVTFERDQFVIFGIRPRTEVVVDS
jgi:hypothetical protein